MEHLIIGSTSAKGNRIAWIEAGQAINLESTVGEYSKNPNQAIDRTEEQLRRSMQNLLRQLKEQSLALSETVQKHFDTSARTKMEHSGSDTVTEPDL
jgi:hypothetical protein